MSGSVESEETWAAHVVEHGYYSALKSGSIDGTDHLPHDHAIVRAMNSTYVPNKKMRGEPEKTLFVARLSHDTTEDVLHNAFERYGKIENCRLVRDIVTGRSKGYAFIEFHHLKDMEKAYHECHQMFLDGAQLVVDYECERILPGWIPRRLGGGLGGRKESGQLRFGGRERPFKKPITPGSRHLGRGGWRGGGGEGWRGGRGGGGEGWRGGRGGGGEGWRAGRGGGGGGGGGRGGWERQRDRSPNRRETRHHSRKY